MTDRIRTLTVVLDKEMRTDDIEVVVNAIRMIKRVDKVVLGEPQDMDNYTASSDFKRDAGRILNNVVDAASGFYTSGAEKEFWTKIKAASAELKAERGY